VAAALAIIAGLYLWQSRATQERGMVLRGQGGRGSSTAAQALEVRPAPAGSGGVLELRWRAVTGAEAYEVRLYWTDLTELARLGPVAEPHLTLRAQDFPGSVPSRSILIWQVAALRGGEAIQLSPTATLRAP
jgi:hypothetical protein